MKIRVQVPKGGMPYNVDDFPKDCERSCKGALYFRKNSMRTMTQDEYNHVLNSPKHKDFGKRLLVVMKGDSKVDKARKAKEAVAPKAAAPAKPAAAAKAPAKEDASEASKPTKKTKAGS